MQPATTFANGINPFQGLIAILPTLPKVTMPKPTPPAKRRLAKNEDYSMPYQASVYPTVEDSLMVAVAVPDTLVDCGLTITNDPLPAKRAAPLYKYHPVFERMRLGQSLRVPTANVGRVSASLRKYIEVKGNKAHVKSQTRYCEDAGFGRVWLLAGVSQMPKRKRVGA